MTATPAGEHGGGAPFARICLPVYALLILYASWFPFSGWQVSGLSPWAYLTAPLPHYWTTFDALTNIAAYVPFGLLAVLALHPRIAGIGAIVLATLAGAMLTGVIEAAQTFLPSRVSSNLDFYCNMAGAFAGAVLGHVLSDTFLKQSRLLAVRQRWFLPEAGFGMVLLGLWPLAQIYPQEVLFGHGQFAETLSAWLSGWLAMPVDPSELLLGGEQLTVEQYWLYETIVTTCGLTGTILVLLFLLRRSAPKLALSVVLIVAALTAKSLASALFFSPENAFTWLTPAARGGILLALMMLSGLAFARPAAQRRIAIAALLISVAIVNAIPVNPYFSATLQTWAQGKFLNFNGAAQFLSIAWPFAALWYLTHLRRSAKHR